MNKNAKYTVLAEAVRVECNTDSGDVYIVFKVTDHDFKKNVKNDWTKDIELKVINKKLIKPE